MPKDESTYQALVKPWTISPTTTNSESQPHTKLRLQPAQSPLTAEAQTNRSVAASEKVRAERQTLVARSRVVHNELDHAWALVGEAALHGQLLIDPNHYREF
jgi:hypothetical protein